MQSCSFSLGMQSCNIRPRSPSPEPNYRRPVQGQTRTTNPDDLVHDFNDLKMIDSPMSASVPTATANQPFPAPSIYNTLPEAWPVILANKARRRARPAVASSTVPKLPRPAKYNAPSRALSRMNSQIAKEASHAHPRTTLSTTPSRVTRPRGAARSRKVAFHTHRIRLALESRNPQDKIHTALCDPDVRAEILMYYRHALGRGDYPRHHLKFHWPDTVAGRDLRHARYDALLGGLIKDFAETSGMLLSKEDVVRTITIASNEALADLDLRAEIHELFYRHFEEYVAFNGPVEPDLADESSGFRNTAYDDLVYMVIPNFRDKNSVGKWEDVYLSREDVLGVLAMGRRLDVSEGDGEVGCRCKEWRGCRNKRLTEKSDKLEELMEILAV